MASNNPPVNESRTPKTVGSAWSWWYLLFLVQYIAVLWPPFYNKLEPTWMGVPFFYWYQMLWVVIASVCNAVVYFATEKE